jgi:hypothetical protein
MRPEDKKLLDKCVALPPGALIELYSEFTTDSPEWAVIPASAIRIQAREGRINEAFIPILGLCLGHAPDPCAAVHLAKALAAYGRDGQLGAPEVIRRARDIHVTDDAWFWILDSFLWTLGYLGGDEAAAFIAELQAEKTPKVNASDSVYDGKLSAGERRDIHAASLTQVAELIAKDDAGKWTTRLTDLVIVDEQAEEPKTLSPWMTR